VFDFLRSRYGPIALDLGADSVKMLQMKRSGATVRVTACAKWRVPESVRHDPDQRKGATVAAVRDMLAKGNFRGRSVLSALSCADLSIKSIRLPSMSPAELAKAVHAEAGERFGFEVAPDQVCYLHAGQVRQGSETREEIVLMAAPREVIEGHISLMGEMGLRVQHIDPEPLALFRVFERFLRRRSDEQVVTVVVDIGYRATRVLVSRGRQIVFVKNIDLGGARLNEVVAKQLNVPVSEAVDLRMRMVRQKAEDGRAAPEAAASQPAAPAASPAQGGAGRSVDWTLYDAIRGEVDLLGKEIALCLRYCSVTFRGVRPDMVTLTGGEAHDPAVVSLLQEHLNLPCKVGYPLRGIDVSDVDLVGDRRSNLAEWTLSAGLAARGVDLSAEIHEEEDGNRDRLSA
jgi:type IV pilus assembly protein PilM